MTNQEITVERERMRQALNDPQHPWHGSVTLLVQVYASGNEITRTFIRKIAPYVFEETGELLNNHATVSPHGIADAHATKGKA